MNGQEKGKKIPALGVKLSWVNGEKLGDNTNLL
jgi:hypothetical protein